MKNVGISLSTVHVALQININNFMGLNTFFIENAGCAAASVQHYDLTGLTISRLVKETLVFLTSHTKISQSYSQISMFASG